MSNVSYASYTTGIPWYVDKIQLKYTVKDKYSNKIKEYEDTNVPISLYVDRSFETPDKELFEIDGGPAGTAVKKHLGYVNPITVRQHKVIDDKDYVFALKLYQECYPDQLIDKMDNINHDIELHSFAYSYIAVKHRYKDSNNQEANYDYSGKNLNTDAGNAYFVIYSDDPDIEDLNNKNITLNDKFIFTCDEYKDPVNYLGIRTPILSSGNNSYLTTNSLVKSYEDVCIFPREYSINSTYFTNKRLLSAVYPKFVVNRERYDFGYSYANIQVTYGREYEKLNVGGFYYRFEQRNEWNIEKNEIESYIYNFSEKSFKNYQPSFILESFAIGKTIDIDDYNKENNKFNISTNTNITIQSPSSNDIEFRNSNIILSFKEPIEINEEQDCVLTFSYFKNIYPNNYGLMHIKTKIEPKYDPTLILTNVYYKRNPNENIGYDDGILAYKYAYIDVNKEFGTDYSTYMMIEYEESTKNANNIELSVKNIANSTMNDDRDIIFNTYFQSSYKMVYSMINGNSNLSNLTWKKLTNTSTYIKNGAYSVIASYQTSNGTRNTQIKYSYISYAIHRDDVIGYIFDNGIERYQPNVENFVSYVFETASPNTYYFDKYDRNDSFTYKKASPKSTYYKVSLNNEQNNIGNIYNTFYEPNSYVTYAAFSNKENVDFNYTYKNVFSYIESSNDVDFKYLNKTYESGILFNQIAKMFDGDSLTYFNTSETKSTLSKSDLKKTDDDTYTYTKYFEEYLNKSLGKITEEGEHIYDYAPADFEVNEKLVDKYYDAYENEGEFSLGILEEDLQNYYNNFIKDYEEEKLGSTINYNSDYITYKSGESGEQVNEWYSDDEHKSFISYLSSANYSETYITDKYCILNATYNYTNTYLQKRTANDICKITYIDDIDSEYVSPINDSLKVSDDTTIDLFINDESEKTEVLGQIKKNLSFCNDYVQNIYNSYVATFVNDNMTLSKFIIGLDSLDSNDSMLYAGTIENSYTYFKTAYNDLNSKNRKINLNNEDYSKKLMDYYSSLKSLIDLKDSVYYSYTYHIDSVTINGETIGNYTTVNATPDMFENNVVNGCITVNGNLYSNVDNVDDLSVEINGSWSSPFRNDINENYDSFFKLLAYLKNQNIINSETSNLNLYYSYGDINVLTYNGINSYTSSIKDNMLCFTYGDSNLFAAVIPYSYISIPADVIQKFVEIDTEIFSSDFYDIYQHDLNEDDIPDNYERYITDIININPYDNDTLIKQSDAESTYTDEFYRKYVFSIAWHIENIYKQYFSVVDKFNNNLIKYSDEQEKNISKILRYDSTVRILSENYIKNFNIFNISNIDDLKMFVTLKDIKELYDNINEYYVKHQIREHLKRAINYYRTDDDNDLNLLYKEYNVDDFKEELLAAQNEICEMIANLNDYVDYEINSTIYSEIFEVNGFDYKNIHAILKQLDNKYLLCCEYCNGFNIQYLVDENNNFVNIYEIVNNDNYHFKYLLTDDSVQINEKTNLSSLNPKDFDNSIKIEVNNEFSKLHILLYYNESFISEIKLLNNDVEKAYSIPEIDCVISADSNTKDLIKLKFDFSDTISYIGDLDLKYKIEYSIDKISSNGAGIKLVETTADDSPFVKEYQFYADKKEDGTINDAIYVVNYRLKVYDDKYSNNSPRRHEVFYITSEDTDWETVQVAIKPGDDLSTYLSNINTISTYNIRNIELYAMTYSSKFEELNPLWWTYVGTLENGNPVLKLIQDIYSN